jgi:hypothetical protein
MFRLVCFLVLSVLLPLFLQSQTQFTPGEIAVLGVNANTFACGGPSGGDEISFVCFKDIEPGTIIDITDNGWERCNAGQWGDSEGFIRLTRTGGYITAGTVITYKHLSVGSFGTYQFISPDADWVVTDLNTVNPLSTAVNMNAGGDQMFFMSGGVWSNLETTFSNDATYSGSILFGFNSKSTWQANCTNSPTQNSNLHPDIASCFHMEPASARDYAKYTGPLTATNRLTWIGRIKNQANWSFFTDCTAYLMTAPIYSNGLQLQISPTNIGITSGFNGVCPGDTGYLQLLLPNNGGPFGVTWNNLDNSGSATTVSGMTNGSLLPVLPIKSGVYAITGLTDANGCTILGKFSDFYLEVFPKDTTRLYEPTCDSSNINVSIERLMNRFGCDSTIFNSVFFDTIVCAIAVTAAATPASCFGFTDGTLIISAAQGSLPISYIWKNLTTTLQGIGTIAALNRPDTLRNMSAGTYQILFKDDRDVQIVLDTVIFEALELRGQIGILSDFNGFSVRCANDANGRVAAAVTGGTGDYSFLWSNGESKAIADSLSAGQQSLTITDAAGCTLIFNVNLTEPRALEANIAIIGEDCFGKHNASILIENLQGGLPEYQIFFGNTDISGTTELNDLPPGTYNIKILDKNDCELIYSAILPVGRAIDLEIGRDTAIFTGDTIVLNIESMEQLDTLLFTPEDFAQMLNPDKALFFPMGGTFFKLIAIDENGCIGLDSIYIRVKKERTHYAPNVFTPEGQLPENQHFTLFTDDGVAQVKQFQIFDRYGELVFLKEDLSLNQPFEGWDGLVGKKKAAQGLYVWSAMIIYTDGRKKLEKGDVLLLRKEK